jgi:hypothetical protein
LVDQRWNGPRSHFGRRDAAIVVAVIARAIALVESRRPRLWLGIDRIIRSDLLDPEVHMSIGHGLPSLAESYFNVPKTSIPLESGGLLATAIAQYFQP